MSTKPKKNDPSDEPVAMKAPAKAAAMKVAPAEKPVQPPKAAAKGEPKVSAAKAKAETAAELAAELALPEVQTLIKMGKSKGNLTQDEIDGALGDIDLSEDQVDNVYAHFVRSGIDIA